MFPPLALTWIWEINRWCLKSGTALLIEVTAVTAAAMLCPLGGQRVHGEIDHDGAVTEMLPPLPGPAWAVIWLSANRILGPARTRISPPLLPGRTC